MLIQLPQFMSDEELLSMEDQVEPSNDENPDATVGEEEDNLETLSSLQESLKKARWNVFMFLGIALLMFAFALF